MSKPNITNQRRVFEIVAVIITGTGKFIFMDWLNWRLPYISIACIFWITYVAYQYQKEPAILNYWGLSKKEFKGTFLELLPWAIGLVGLFILIGNQLGSNILNWKIIPILLLYPIWGIIQQFLIVGLIARNLQDLTSINISTFLIVFITAFVFAIVHYPSLLLVIGTFFLAILYTLLYLNKRNLLVLGIYHGWLGAFFFYTLLERDPWQEVFGTFIQ